ncbi:hypothetical protein BD780_000807 [Clostridium tetanomorphum]|nr:EndoU domain-containing protein [Clostridium tetanomorphum]MBP1863484.1 hypothetical protein [Clostridium tetanomorphum]NRS83582.1 hypothetical protein [Clostridium tetanomorphum]SQC01959.1 peptidoglycan-binding protein [Clostridium tetanomorphum]
MDFQLDIGELTNTINEYENFIKILSEQKENINKAVKELTDLGWSGEAKDKFLENHIKKQEFYTKLEEDIKYMKSALENDEKPKAVQLKKRSEDFENCIKRSGGAALTSDDSGVISLQYGGQFPINNNVNECTNDYYRRMNSKFEEILNLANSLSFTSFSIEGDVENAENSLRNQTMSLTDFDNSFNVYCSDVRDMEDNICSVFSKISGITEGISKFRDVSIISENGQVDKNEVRQLMLKNPGELTAEEKQILEYAKIVLGEDEYKKIKETVFTYEEAGKYIKCNVLGIDVGFKTYFANEISNLPKQIVYKKDGYTYIYDLIQCPPPTFYGVELPNDDIVTKDGGVISNKLYGYKLVYTNEPVVLTGIVSVSSIEGVTEVESIVSKNALEHIFHGNINGKGLPSGYHKPSIMSKATISNISSSDKFGVYKGMVEMNGKTKFSTFFPDSWNRVNIINSIKEVHEGIQFNKAGWYTGKTSSGMPIKMWLNEKGLVDTAFPVYSK